jgi:hypothetical protein
MDELEKLALDESWAYFFRWLLLGPYGANLRNDVAHGFVFDPGPVYAALLLRAVSVLVLVADTLPNDEYLPEIGTDQVDVRPRQAVARHWPIPSAATISGASAVGWLIVSNEQSGGYEHVPSAAARAGESATERDRVRRTPR